MAHGLIRASFALWEPIQELREVRAVELSNKLARIVFAILCSGEGYNGRPVAARALAWQEDSRCKARKG
jgi:hypothetical protein